MLQVIAMTKGLWLVKNGQKLMDKLQIKVQLLHNNLDTLNTKNGTYF